MKNILLLTLSLTGSTSWAQPTLVKQFTTGSQSSAQSFEKLNDKLIFNAYYGGGLDSYEIWATDGTSVGTGLLKGGSRLEGGHTRCKVGNVLFFAAPGGLWKTDGTKEGTVWVANYQGNGMAALGNLLIYSKYSGADAGLWKSDGTTEGSVKISNVDAFLHLGVAELDGKLYFAGRHSLTEFHTLWVTDGTREGTQPLGFDIKDPWGLTNQNNKLIFSAGYPVQLTSECSDNPYTLQIPHILKLENNEISVLKQPVYKQVCSDPQRSYPIGSTFSNTQNFIPASNYLYFIGQEEAPSQARHLWRTDGTPEGTVKLITFHNNTASNRLSQFFQNNTKRNRGFTNLFYFPASDDQHGIELWRSDGTPEGTFMVKDINPGAAHSEPIEIRTVNGITYFFAHNPETGTELWQTDGTEAGTQVVTDLNPGSEGQFTSTNVNPFDLFGIDLGDHYYFGGTTGKQGGLFSTKLPAEPLPVTLNITDYFGIHSNSVWQLPKITTNNGYNQYHGYVRGDANAAIAQRYTLHREDNKWLLQYGEKLNQPDWSYHSRKAVNGLNSSSKPPCSGWSDGISLTGDCEPPYVDFTLPAGAPALNSGAITTTGSINGKNTYAIPVTDAPAGTEATITWNGSQWVISLEEPNARTAATTILSTNSGDYGANPPCTGWTNGYALSGDVCLSSPLPVSLASFTAQRRENKIWLNWKTTQEVNASHFEVERSFNGLDFELVASVFASQKSSTYQAFDNGFSTTSETLYYRLKSVDLDGTFSYSPIVSVQLAERKPFAVYPNPAADYLELPPIATGTSTRWEIIDMGGRKVASGQASHPIISITNLPAGIYHLVLPDSHNRKRQKFVKN